MQTTIIAATNIFTGNEWLSNHVVIIENERIQEIVPAHSIATSSIQQKVQTLLPAFIDLQIYGAHGKLLAVHPTVDAMNALHEYCLEGGAPFFMPTVATNATTVLYDCIEAVRKYWKQGGKGCLGLHIEGPWINTTKRGAHIEAIIHSPTLEEVKTLLNYGKDVIKIITLAPEICTKEVLSLIKKQNIIISAGHSNATYSQAYESFQNGVTTITHLYNAMSGLQHREPGLVGAAFNHPSVMASIIPDGYHVNFEAIQIAKKIMQQRLFVITDAVTQTNQGLYPHELAGDKYESNHILSGSALTMKKALFNLIQHCAIEPAEAIRMCSLYPAQVLQLDYELGKIEKGYKAVFTQLDYPII